MSLRGAQRRDNPFPYHPEGGAHRKGLVCIFAFGENYGSPPSSRRRRSSETLHKNKIEESQHPLRDASFFYGLSHGLKIARQLSIFTQVCALVSPFRVPSLHKNLTGYPEWDNLLNGTPEGTRTPDLLVRSQSLYPTELPARTHSLSSAYTY